VKQAPETDAIAKTIKSYSWITPEDETE